MSDLQCPATFYVLGPGDGPGEEDAAPLPAGRDEARIALVRCAPGRAGLGEHLAGDLGCGVEVDESLAGDVRAVLVDIADLHRGESVVVLPASAYPGRPPQRWLRVRVDSHGPVAVVLGQP